MKLWSLILQEDNWEINPLIRNITLSADDSFVKIGRAGKRYNTLQINQTHIAREHCEIFVKDRKLYVKSIDRQLPTILNDHRLPFGKECHVHHRDIIIISTNKCRGKNYEYLVIETEHEVVEVVKEEPITETQTDNFELLTDIKKEKSDSNLEIIPEYKSDINNEYLNSNDIKIEIEEHPIPDPYYEDEAKVKVETPYIYKPDYNNTLSFEIQTNASFLNYKEPNTENHNLITHDNKQQILVKQEHNSDSNHSDGENTNNINWKLIPIEVDNDQFNEHSNKNTKQNELKPPSNVEITSNSIVHETRKPKKRELLETDEDRREKSIESNKRRKRHNKNDSTTRNENKQVRENHVKISLKRKTSTETETIKKVTGEEREQIFILSPEIHKNTKMTRKGHKEKIKTKHSSPIITHDNPSDTESITSLESLKFESSSNTQSTIHNEIGFKPFLKPIKYTNEDKLRHLKIPRRNSSTESEHEVIDTPRTFIQRDPRKAREKIEYATAPLPTIQKDDITPDNVVIGDGEKIGPSELRDTPRTFIQRDPRKARAKIEHATAPLPIIQKDDITTDNVVIEDGDKIGPSELRDTSRTFIQRDPRKAREKIEHATAPLPTIQKDDITTDNIVIGDGEKIGPSELRAAGPRRRISHLSSRTGSESDSSDHDSDEKNDIVTYTTTVAEEETRAIHTILHWSVDQLEEAVSNPDFVTSVWKQQHIHLTDSEIKRQTDKIGKISPFNKPDRFEDDRIRPRTISKMSYDSYAPYNMAMQPPLYVLLFNLLRNNYRNNSEHIKAKLVGLSNNKETNKTFKSIKLKFELGDSQQILLNKGDFVVLGLPETIKLPGSGEKREITRKYIGYITDSQHLNTKPEKDAHGKLLFIHVYYIEVMLRYPEHSIEQLQMVYVQPIREIGKEYLMIRGLFELSESPLEPLILNPNKRTLTRPSFIQNKMKIDASLQTMNMMIDHLKQIMPISEEQLKIAKCITKTLCCVIPSVNIIEGETGTGKSHILVWIILLLLSDNIQRNPRCFTQRILVCLASDEVLNEFAIQLYEAQEYIFKQTKITSTFDMVVLETDASKIDSRVKRFNLENQSSRFLKSDKKYKEVIDNSLLTLVTRDTITNVHFQESCRDKMKIPICIIDDAQSLSEIHTLQMLVCYATKIILAGDLTLPVPVMESKEARSCGLHNSLLQRVAKSLNRDIERRSHAEPSSSLVQLTPDKLDETTYYKLIGPQYRTLTPLSQITSDVLMLKSPSIMTNQNPMQMYPFVLLEHEFSVNRSTHEDKSTSYKDWVKKESKIAANLVLNIQNLLNSRVEKKTRFFVVTANSKYLTTISKSLRKEQEARMERNSLNLPQLQHVVTSLYSVHQTLGLECDVMLLCVGQSDERSAFQDSRNLRLALTRAKHSLIVLGNLEYLTDQRQIKEWKALKDRASLEEIYMQIGEDTNLKDIVHFNISV